MKIVTTKSDGQQDTYLYDPEHFDGVVSFYAESLKNAEIVSFSVTL